MSSQNTIPYQLTLYSFDFRWNGIAEIPSFRRLTDFMNDPLLAVVSLKNAQSSIWMNETLRELHSSENVTVVKRNTVLAISHTDVEPTHNAAFERVNKVPFRILIHLPPYTVIGDLSILPNTDWLKMFTQNNQEFFPITKANVWRTKSGVQLENDLKLLLVNRQEIIAIEPQK
jgi:hypothetical protein